jgi:hypothetical protein
MHEVWKYPYLTKLVSMQHCSDSLWRCCIRLFQPFDVLGAGMDLMLTILHNSQQCAHALVSKLLDNVLQELPVSSMEIYQAPSESEGGSASMFSAVNKLMMMPALAVSNLWNQDNWGRASSPAADASLSLLLLLLHQMPTSAGSEGSAFQKAFKVS